MRRRASPVRLGGAVLAAALAALFAAGCVPSPESSASPNPAADGPAIVVTTAILGDVAAEVLADTTARIEVLLAPGTDPHTYAPSVADARRVAEADLVLANGLGLEAQLDDLLDGAERDGVRVEHLGEAADPIPFDLDDDEDPDDHVGESAQEAADHDHGGLDPHVWLDPSRVALMAQAIADAYAEVAPDEADVARAAGTAVADRYEALATELATALDGIAADERVLVTSHDALGYFADAFDFRVLATVLPGTSTQAELSASDLQELIELLDEAGVDAIFTEPTSSTRAAESIAEALDGVELVELYTGSLGPPGSGADTLAGMLRLDVERIVAALTR